MSVMEKLDAVSAATLQAANISEALLPTLSREDIRDLFPGPEHFLRRKAIWNLFHTDQEGQQTASPNQENGSNGRGLATVQVNPCVSETPRSSDPTPPQPDVQETLGSQRTLQLPNPEYVVYTDSELEHFRKQYFEMQRVGQERGCTLSKELRCRLVRNTVTNMVSIIRATTTDFMYPSKNDVQAMAKRLVEYYPMLRDNSVNCKHTWELLFKQLLKRLHNIKTPKKRQGPTPQRRRKRRRLNFECADGDSSTSISESPGSTASTVILDRTRSSASSLDGMNSPAEIVDQSGKAAEDLGVHSGTDSQQSQARHYRTLQEMYKRQKPNKEAVAQLLDLEFDARRAFINSDTLRDQDRPANILQAYPCFREVDNVMDELRRILDRSNPDFIADLKTRWESFYGKAQFYGVFKKVLRPPTTQDKVTRSVAMMKALPEMFPSPVALPKKLGHASEAVVHVLEPTENPTTYLQRRPVFSPVLIICDSNCMLAIGSTPVTTFPKENIDTGVLYLLAYYYTFHLTYPKCIATLLSILQTEVLQDAIHDRDATSSYKKTLSEWKKFIGE
ncbi:uncharacterized protein LOC111189493 [Astyanax mexicanus]|uniref:uncharacterized protein LOC111189493 n=1 Tax=Astyanax mexicanus TaxID=7994 RepID=UPI0020CAA783|nr:uncharacterized protein LOC111189493 [Astyanax mexicanus]XP_049331202.1 uncharacterized protein LOC111189493 [Astyanax mexicanus]